MVFCASSTTSSTGKRMVNPVAASWKTPGWSVGAKVWATPPGTASCATMGEEEGWAKRDGAARKRTQNRARVCMGNMVGRWDQKSTAREVCPYIGLIVY